MLDDADAKLAGDWVLSTVAGAHQAGTGYLHDGNARKGKMSARWTPEIAEAGDYEIALLFAPNPNRATNAPVSIELSGQPAQTVKVNQRETSGVKTLGKFALPKGKAVTITLSNRDTDGFVIADGVVLRRLQP